MAGTAQQFKGKGGELRAKRAKIFAGHALKNVGRRIFVRISGLRIANLSLNISLPSFQ